MIPKPSVLCATGQGRAAGENILTRRVVAGLHWMILVKDKYNLGYTLDGPQDGKQTIFYSRRPWPVADRPELPGALHEYNHRALLIILRGTMIPKPPVLCATGQGRAAGENTLTRRVATGLHWMILVKDKYNLGYTLDGPQDGKQTIFYSRRPWPVADRPELPGALHEYQSYSSINYIARHNDIEPSVLCATGQGDGTMIPKPPVLCATGQGRAACENILTRRVVAGLHWMILVKDKYNLVYIF